MIQFRRFLTRTLLLLSLSGWMVNSGSALNIVLNPNTTLASDTQALAAFERASLQWESAVVDDVTVYIDAGLASLSAGVLGSAGSVSLAASYDIITAAMIADESTEYGPQLTAMSHLPADMTFITPAGITTSDSVRGTKANLKALGFAGLDTVFGQNDATITFSTNFTFDYDNSDGVGAGSFDLETIAAHEIGHALGFVSTVDTVDFLSNQGASGVVTPSILDLFRFDDLTGNPDSYGDFGTFSRSLMPGGDPYFDVLTTEIGFSSGSFTGDGRQASHWEDGLGIGLMDPTLSPGEITLISDFDLTAFDAIGWELAQVPDSASTAWLFGGMMPVLLYARRRRARESIRRQPIS